MAKDENLILIDTDVLIHLSKAEKMSLLSELFPGRVYMLDFVVEELRFPGSQVDMMLKLGVVKEMQFPTNNLDILKEYNQLKNTKGKGESACMAICKFQRNILASSNLKDIVPYCREHSIKFLTTLDILAIGYKRGKISDKECDDCIKAIRAKGSTLPDITIQRYVKDSFNLDKLNY